MILCLRIFYSVKIQSELSQLVTEVGICYSPAVLKLNAIFIMCNRFLSK
jgi:hypothetical protein